MIVKHPPEQRTALRYVDLSAPLLPIDDVQGFSAVRIFVQWRERLLGSLEIVHHGRRISVTRLRDAIADALQVKALEPESHLREAQLWGSAHAVLAGYVRQSDQRFAGRDAVEPLAPATAVSVVVATRDRPDDLRACLQSLMTQETTRPYEIVVVDNNPSSGQTPRVTAAFPGVMLVDEDRPGLSYARNAGICASTGEIVIATDDDVVVPPHWLETLVAPFARHDVMVVTGNVLPLELETEAQHLFEAYGGLGRGFDRIEADRGWFDKYRRKAVPTWRLGATANAAFRATIFADQQVGLLNEALGAGTPTGCSEDTDLFYKVLKAGYTIVYEPNAYVWHRHRRTMAALRHQVYSYSKGHVAYHLLTLLRDHDRRALTRLLVELPRSHALRIKQRVRGRSSYPVSMIVLEIAGNIAGSWALWQSLRRVERLGRSPAYVPVAQRVGASATHPE